jgi:hypothetical protein
MFRFSEQLTEKIKLYFKKRYSFDLSSEQADECLCSLADMYLLYAESSENNVVVGFADGDVVSGSSLAEL